jgi:hypothetical protein
MRLALWPGGGGGPADMAPLGPSLRARDVEPTFMDPAYSTRADWRMSALAEELAATGADAFGGTSWGAAVAATAAAASPPRALVLLDGGHFGGPDFPASTMDEVVELAEQGKLPTDVETTRALFRAYVDYDAVQTLGRLDRATRVLLVAAGRNEFSLELIPRFAELVPWGEVRVVESGHGVVEEMPDELGALVADWLAAA